MSEEGEKRRYEMSQQQFDKIWEAINQAQSTPLIALQYGMPTSPQEAANRAWLQLGKEMGFDGATVMPCGGGELVFMAMPLDSDEVKK